MRFLTVAEVRRLAVAVGPGYRALILLGAYGGLRIGEMTGLRRKRLDLEFYDHFFKPGAYLATHATHMARWHGQAEEG